MRGREVTASPREVISEERDISDSRNGEIKRPTRVALFMARYYAIRLVPRGFTRSREVLEREGWK